MRRLLKEAFPGYEQLLESGALKICHLIIRRMFDVHQGEHLITASIAVNRAVEYIYSHYSERITVEDLAHEANFSPSHFSRLFKKELNQSPAEYLLHTRLDFAKRMLRNPDKSLTEIALDCGFGSSSYFSQCFSKAFTMSPSQFQKSKHVVNMVFNGHRFQRGSKIFMRSIHSKSRKSKISDKYLKAASAPIPYRF